MTDQNKPVVILASEQEDIINALINDSSPDFEIVQRTMHAMSIEDENPSVTILDMDAADNDVGLIKKQIIQIKNDHPTQVLVVLGERESLVDLLSPSIQALIYRVFTKPVTPSQVLLSVPSAIKSHQNLKDREQKGEQVCFIDPADLKLLMSEEDTNKKKNVSMVASVIGILVFIGAIYFISTFLIGGDRENAAATITFSQVGIVEEEESVEAIFSENSQNSRVAELNQLAEDAESAGNLILPEWDSALSYYQQALEIDEFNLTAYIGTRRIIKLVEADLPGDIKANRYAKAQVGIAALQSFDPLNKNTQTLSKQLKDAVTARIVEVQKQTGDTDEIAELNGILSKLGDGLTVSDEALAKLAREQELLAEIDLAIETRNLIPPKQNNAYDLISTARANKTVSPSSLIERAQALSQIVFNQGKESVEADQLGQARSYLNILQKLNVSRKSIGSLQQLIEAKQQRIRLAQQSAQKEQESSNQVSDNKAPDATVKKPLLEVIAAKAIKRASPRYPRRALNRGTEGWVQLASTITETGEVTDVRVVASEPGETFDNAAIKALKKWEFVPAYDPNTNSPVASKFEIKLNFKLN